CPRVKKNKMEIPLMDSSTPHTQNSLLSEDKHFQTTSKSNEQPILLTHTQTKKQNKKTKSLQKVN
ncbi:hypothetical protein DKP78_17825, partial [Enterococcus faecium]